MFGITDILGIYDCIFINLLINTFIASNTSWHFFLKFFLRINKLIKKIRKRSGVNLLITKSIVNAKLCRKKIIKIINKSSVNLLINNSAVNNKELNYFKKYHQH